MATASLWLELKSYRAPVPPTSYAPIVPEDDDPDTYTCEDEAAPDWEPQSITGRTFVLSYVDAKKALSERLVQCRRLADKAGTLYLDAFCYVRERPRSFRGDRIASMLDPQTGEVFEPGLPYLQQFLPDAVSAAPFRYGLAPQEFADLNAALNVLAFMARCDGLWHPLEREAILQFAASYWLRAEVPCALDEEEVLRHAARLAPDAESFWASLSRCARHPVLRAILKRHVAAVIDADGIHHPHELYWGRQVDEFLSA